MNNNIKYVYPILEVRGVDVNNIEQDLYGAVKSIPKASALGVGVLGAIGYSKIKRYMKFRKAKSDISKFGNEFLEEITEWHELNDNKLSQVCESAVTNYKNQIKNLSKQYKNIEQQQSQNPNFKGIPDSAKKEHVDTIIKMLSDKLKRQIDDYYKGLNTWSVSLLKQYTEEIFVSLIDKSMSTKINDMRSSKKTKNGVHEGIVDTIKKYSFTRLSKQQVKELEGVWLKTIMRVNAEASDITNQRIQEIRQTYFKSNDNIGVLGDLFDMNAPKGFMTSEVVNNIKAYISDLASTIQYVDKKLISDIQVNAEDYISQDNTDNTPTANNTSNTSIQDDNLLGDEKIDI